jgi:hypothetical protein
MFKKFFTFGSVVVSIFLIFVIFFFESISHWGDFAQVLRILIVAYTVLHFSFIFYYIYLDKKDREKNNILDAIIRRTIEKRKKRNLIERGFG